MAISGVGGNMVDRWKPAGKKQLYANQYTTAAGTPNWDNIPHKGMPRPSDEEFEKIIDDFGKQLAGAKNDAEYRKIMWECEQMGDVYLSAVSPDRKEMAGQAADALRLSQLAEGLKEPEKPDEWLTLFDYIDMAKGVKKNEKGEDYVSLPSGADMVFVFGGPTVGINIRQDGVDLLGARDGEWTVGLTDGERAMMNSYLKQVYSATAFYKRNPQAAGEAPAPAPQSPSDRELDILA